MILQRSCNDKDEKLIEFGTGVADTLETLLGRSRELIWERQLADSEAESQLRPCAGPHFQNIGTDSPKIASLLSS
jgi:hypothetical protein